MEITNEKFLRKKENRIKSSISHGEIHFIATFNFLHKYYTLNTLAGKTPVLSVFDAIYIKNLDLPAWKLAIYCNVSRTTLFNYRNAIVKDFYICLQQKLISKEISITDGEKL